MPRKVSLTTIVDLSDVVERPQSVIVYRGPSLYDGSPVAMIVTGLNAKSGNEKTGAMVQTYVIPDNGKKVHENVFGGTDTGACGDCPHRYAGGSGTCYVNPVTGANQVSLGLINDTYPEASPERAAALIAGRNLRLGAYGDPAMVPEAVWLPLIDAAGGRTGYTHQWRRAFARWLRPFVMASVESDREADAARRRGWRTFRVRRAADPVRADEIVCPASAEGDKRRTCETCLACNGGSTAKRSVAIIGHGPTWKVSRLNKLLTAKRQRKALPVYN